MGTLGTIWHFIVAHQLAVAYVVAVLIDNMPAATAQSGGLYRWVFGVLQALAANLTRAKMGVQGTLTQK